MAPAHLSNKEEEYFEKVLLPSFSQEFPDIHYTFDMFTNLARPYATQDKRASEQYWIKKASTGDQCYKLWERILALPIASSAATPIVAELVQRLKKWYNEESAHGLTRNPNSRGTNAPIKKIHDISLLNRACPEFAPWDEQKCKLLRVIVKDDNPLVAMMKRRFRDYYDQKNEKMLSVWSSERKFFYKHRENIIKFLDSIGLDSSDRINICSLLKFSDNYKEEMRMAYENKSSSL